MLIWNNILLEIENNDTSHLASFWDACADAVFQNFQMHKRYCLHGGKCVHKYRGDITTKHYSRTRKYCIVNNANWQLRRKWCGIIPNWMPEAYLIGLLWRRPRYLYLDTTTMIMHGKGVIYMKKHLIILESCTRKYF